MTHLFKRNAGRRIRIEHLESRRLLAAEFASGLSLDLARDQIAGRFTAATIVTHGFQIDGAGDSLMPLAEAIVERNGGLLVDIDVIDGSTGNGVPTFDLFQSESKAGTELVFLFDWGDASNNDSAGWGEAAGDALFSIGAGLGLFDPDAGLANSIDLHFIGHSFGTAVTSEAIERLAAYNVPVDHVTYLDPHDFDQSRLPVDGSQRLFDLGLPQFAASGSDGYGASVWENVSFADAYYQTNSLGLIPINPGGRPIPGAYNVSVTQATEDFFIPHSAVWNDFYLDTITDLAATTGYGFSSRVIDKNDRPEPIFFGPNQDHEHTSTTIVSRTTGLPNQDGLASLELTIDEITNARWAPQWSPGIFNGDFDFIGNESDEVPAWAFHGGGGNGEFRTGTDNGLRFAQQGQSRTSNLVYLPKNVSHLEYELAFDESDTDAVLEIFIGETRVESLALGSLTAIEHTVATTIGLNRSIAIPSLGGTTRTITVRLASAPSTVNVQVDDLNFTRVDRSFELEHRTMVVESVAGPQSIPVDSRTIAIQFQAEADATIQVELTDSTTNPSLTWTSVFIVDDQFASIGTVDGLKLTAEVVAGTTYALLFDPIQATRSYVVTSSAGATSLNRLAPTNLFAPSDVNADGRISALDALIVINALNSLDENNAANRGNRPFLDVNDDGSITALDALRVINVLNARDPRGGIQSEPDDEKNDQWLTGFLDESDFERIRRLGFRRVELLNL